MKCNFTYKNYNYKYVLTAFSFIEFIPFLFLMPEVKDNKLAFFSNNLCQDPLENYFGCQRQHGGCHDNPTVNDLQNNTQSLRVANSLCYGPVKGNCRGSKSTSTLCSTDYYHFLEGRRFKKQFIMYSYVKSLWSLYYYYCINYSLILLL